jgi:hypothetical protein
MKTVSIAFCLIFWLPCIAQQPAAEKTSRPATQNEALAKPRDWGEVSIRLFKDSEMQMTFGLATSWIPGEEHKGMFRYRLSAYPKTPQTIAERARFPELYSPAAIESFVERVQKCDFILELFDSDQFKLRNVSVFFNRAVDEQARLIGLETNSSSQMDADEYRKLIGNAVVTGSWEIGRACNGAP